MPEKPDPPSYIWKFLSFPFLLNKENDSNKLSDIFPELEMKKILEIRKFENCKTKCKGKFVNIKLI